MNDRSEAHEPDRLPWLPDERKSRRFGAAVIMFSCLLVIAALATAVFYSPWTIRITAADDPGDPSAERPQAQISEAPQPSVPTYSNLQLHPPPDPVPEPVAVNIAASRPGLPARTPPDAALNSAAKSRAAPAATAAQPTVTPTKAAGSECRFATTPAARALCSNPALSELQREHALLYNQSWGHADNAKRALLVQARQRAVNKRDACPTDACITGVYLAAMRELSGIMSAKVAPSPVLASTPSACKTTRRPSEIAICGDANLLALDRHQALLFSQSWGRADTARRSRLRRTQTRLVARRDKCHTELCTRSAYLAAMREVTEIMVRR